LGTRDLGRAFGEPARLAWPWLATPGALLVAIGAVVPGEDVLSVPPQQGIDDIA
jgi:hypothetical protein